jgi:adenylate kinase family enzyme
MVNRILHRGEGRTDDNIETLTRRLNTYRESTQPIANLFEQQGKLIKINADGDPESIFNLIKPPLGLN